LLGLDPLAIVGGDGFQATVHAGNLIVYLNCNAGLRGLDLPGLPPSPFFTNFKIERIWDDDTAPAQKHWSDPHRPGHLLRLPNIGLLFRPPRRIRPASMGHLQLVVPF
jgi:hypothetical protein